MCEVGWNVFLRLRLRRLIVGDEQNRRRARAGGAHATALTCGVFVETLESRQLLSLVTPAHIVVVVEEDRAANAIGDTTNMPYFNQLASTGLVYSNSHGLNTPSQEGEMNYLALYSGSTQGVTDDSYHGPFTGANLAQSLNNAGKSFIGYAEAMPHDGDTTDQLAGDPSDPAYDDLYTRSYNPMAQFSNVGTGKTNTNVNKTFASFPTTAAGYAALPTVSFVIPDTRDNTHGSNDTNPYATDPSAYNLLRQNADTWLKNNLNGYLQWAKQNNSLLIVTEDEGDRAHGFTSLATNNVTTIINGDPRLVVPGTDSTNVTPYTILRTIEDMYGLSHLGSSATASDLDTNSAGQLAAPIPQTATTTSLSASANPAAFGQTVTFSATVSGTGTATGTVKFMDGAATLGTVSLNASGAATFMDPGLAVGSHSVTAGYSGDAKDLASASTALSETVNKASTSLVVASSSSTSSTGQAVMFTATLSVIAPGAGTPGGSVQFQIDGANFGSPVAISGGSATSAPTSGLSAGSHTVEAVYSGDPNFSASTSAGITQTVKASLPVYINASSGAAYSYNSSTGALSLTNGTLTFTADNTAAPLINLAASGSASKVIFNTNEHLAGIILSGGAQATVLSLGSARTHSNHNVLVIGTLGSSSDPTFSVDSASKLDLNDNDLIVHTGSSDSNGASENATVESLAALGRNPASGAVGNPDGQWNGNGLSSSAANAADAAAGYEKIGLAVVVNSTLAEPVSSWQVGSFSETLGVNDIIVKYDYLGDYALEGSVDADDAGILQIEYDNGKSKTHSWATGSSMGNGLSDANEAGLFQIQYGLGTGGNFGPQL
jgi:hypothetical protein